MYNLELKNNNIRKSIDRFTVREEDRKLNVIARKRQERY